jgi:hypothetical protein
VSASTNAAGKVRFDDENESYKKCNGEDQQDIQGENQMF